MTREWCEYIQVEDLPELYQTIAGAIGREAMITLALAIPKMNLYLRSPDSIDWEKPVAELPEDYQLCIDAVGVEATIKLASVLTGGLLYLKSADSVFLPAKARYIREHFNGRNHRRLAIATNLSQTFVYDVLRDMDNDFVPEREDKDQLGLFE